MRTAHNGASTLRPSFVAWASQELHFDRQELESSNQSKDNIDYNPFGCSRCIIRRIVTCDSVNTIHV
jgi:type IV pilus biogenesis protein CpaD/CtpE